MQGAGLVGKIREKYPDSVVFQIADHMADDFGIQKLEKIYNLSALDLLKKATSTTKSTGHYIIDKVKYKQTYGADPEEDINETREQAKTHKKATGFLAKIKDKLKWKKSRSSFESSEFYAANSVDDPNTFEIPVTDTNDRTSKTLKVKLQVKSDEETDKDAQHLIK